MWWVMMIAMMTPSAAPLVLLYGRVLSHHGLRESGRGTAFSVASAADATRAPAAATAGLTARGASSYAPSAVLVIGYLLAWLAFSLVAATLQLSLQRAGLVSVSLLSSRSAVLSAAVLLAAGVYQLSPLKHACLRHCRGPVEFLTRHWRPGIRGALSMGARHGAWCVGCCWMLMALLFVGGVMNLAWVALLAVLVLAEKVAPAGPAVGRAVGAVLIVWGIATLVV
jgi:predicted metal-binding membrane protein